MEIFQSKIFKEVKMFRPQRFYDERGWFSEAYNKKQWWEKLQIDDNFVQDNISYTKKQGTLRGLHFQNAPKAQTKVISCIQGQIMDVIVDIRKFSPTFCQHEYFILNPGNSLNVIVPVGFAHGFITLEDDSAVLYKVSNFYSKEHDRSISWCDPAFNIDWGIENPILSEKDYNAPFLINSDCNFYYK